MTRFCGHGFLRRCLILTACLGLASVGCQRASNGPETVPKPEGEKASGSKATTGREVFNRMITAYGKASSYADAGAVHLVAEAGSQKVIDNTWNYSLTLVRPNKIRVQAYQAMLVCDGKKLYGSLESQPGQVLERPAPRRLTLRSLFADRVLAMGLAQGVAGPMPQLLLLLADEPMKALLQDSTEDPTLSEPGEIDGRKCYRVQLKRSFGTTTFWVDQENFILRRVAMPTDEIREHIGGEQPVDRVSLVADFPGAQIDGKIDPKAFAFEVPAGAEIVRVVHPTGVGVPETAGQESAGLQVLQFGGQAGHARIAGRERLRSSIFGPRFVRRAERACHTWKACISGIRIIRRWRSTPSASTTRRRRPSCSPKPSRT